MGYRLEAWNDPSSSSHEVIIKDVPINVLNAGQTLSGFTFGSLNISKDFPRLSEINDPANNVETLLRLFRDETHLCSFYATDRDREYNHAGLATIRGGDIHTGLIHGIVYPFDYVAGEDTLLPDWIYGPDNRYLSNPGFESGTGSTGWEDGLSDGWAATTASGAFITPQLFYVEDDVAEARTGNNSLFIDSRGPKSGARRSFTATNGSARFTISLYVKSATGRRITAGVLANGGYTNHHTNAFRWNGYSMAELTNAVEGAGSTDGTWQLIDLDVTLAADQTSFEVIVIDDETGGGDGPDFRIDDFTIAGPGLGLDPWSDDGFNLDTTTTFEQDTLHVHSGTYSAHAITDGNGADKDGIQQIVIGVEEGVTYTFGIWVYQTSGVAKDFRSILKSPDGSWYGSQVTSVPDSTWTFVAVTGVAVDAVIIVGLRVVQAGSLEFWADDAVLGEGLQEATAGEIVREVMDAIQLRGALDWVGITTFSDTLDSAGDAWDNVLKVRINRGRDMGQVMDLLAQFGIEWYIDWTGTVYELHVYNKFGAGTDRTALDSPKIFPGRGLKTANIGGSSAGPNVVLAEGDGGILAEEEDVVLSAAYGRRESYAGTTDVLGTLDAVTAEALRRSRGRKFGLSVDYSDADFSVWEDLTLGDLLSANLPPDIDDEEFRAVSLSTTLAPGRQPPMHPIGFVYVNETP